jgi:hypothetical protein
MTSPDEYENALREAEGKLKEATTADDVRGVWRKHFGTVGHRALGRLLVGRSADEQLARRARRSEEK